MVVWPATVMLSRGRWMGPMQAVALSGTALAPLSLAAFIVLWLGRAHWVPWLNDATLPNRAWLNDRLLFVRDGAALAIWWLAAWAFARRARQGAPKVLAGWVAFLYAIVFSLLAFDLVMALEPRWFSTLFGAYFFITGMYAAIALLALAAARRRGLDRDLLHDFGKLVLTFSIMATYLMYSQLLPIWYENLPNEILFAVPRMSRLPWLGVSLALLAVVYLGPLVLLLTVKAKRTPWYLGAVSALVLAGLWVERWWLVAPAFGPGVGFGAADVSLCAAFVGALGLAVSRAERRPAVESEGAGNRE